MRVHRVTMAGFGPYRTAQTVDFDAFRDDGIFLIGGKTGAGKSTILDAICFALYGGVPRYDGQPGAVTKLRSDHCAPDDPSYVELEFTVGDRRYRLRRSPEYPRPKSRGDGFTTQKAEAELAVRDGELWVGLEAQLRTVGTKVAEIVQLSQEQFLQVILLAQNRFQEFLLARSEERQALLRTLFGTRRFAEYDDALQLRLKRLEAELGGARGEMERLARQLAELLPGDGAEEERPGEGEAPGEPGAAVAWMAGRVAAQRARLEAATVEAERADAAWQAARVEHERRSELRRAQQRRAEAEARRDALREAAAAVEAEEAGALAAAREHLGGAESLDAAASGLAELNGSLAAALRAEQELPALTRAVSAADAACATADDAVEAAKQQAAGWKSELEAVGPELEAADRAAADEAAARQLVDGITPVAGGAGRVGPRRGGPQDGAARRTRKRRGAHGGVGGARRLAPAAARGPRRRARRGPARGRAVPRVRLDPAPGEGRAHRRARHRGRPRRGRGRPHRCRGGGRPAVAAGRGRAREARRAARRRGRAHDRVGRGRERRGEAAAGCRDGGVQPWGRAACPP